MVKKDYQSILADEFLKVNANLVSYIDRIDNSLKCLNDNSTLHSELLQRNTELLATAVKTNEKNTRNFWILIGVLVLAIITLAGVKQSFEVLKLFV